MINISIFKAYDIRGIYPSDLNEEVAYKISRAYAVLRQKELGREKLKIVMGWDMRLSSPALAEAVKRGLTEQGAEVIDIGLVSTPTFYFAVSYYGYDGGLMVSASHNPKEYNGLKIVRERAMPVGEKTGMEDLRDLTLKEDFPSPTNQGLVIEKKGILDEQVNLEKKYADLSKIERFKIAADPANAMGALYLDRLFAELPQIELIKINWNLDGTFPAHQADPLQEDTLIDLRKKIRAEKADLGLATDGDGDRLFVIDDQGEIVEPAILRGILAQLFLRDNPGATICYDIRPGKITEEMIREAGGLPSVTRVGHSFIKKQMLEVGAVFGGESAGHLFLRFPYGIFEAPMVVILKLLQELSEKKIKMSDYIKPLKKYFHSGEINFKVQNKDEVLQELKEKYQDAEINDLDGLTFTYPDFWFNVRPSNTEALLRLNLEARTEKEMRRRVVEVSEVINI